MLFWKLNSSVTLDFSWVKKIAIVKYLKFERKIKVSNLDNYLKQYTFKVFVDGVTSH